MRASTLRSGLVHAAILLVFGAGAGCGSPPPALCGSGACPDGWHCSAKTDQCIQGLCGNGRIDSGEACDDGGAIDGDVLDGETCNAACTSDETCGNGIRDLTVNPPEVCDCRNDPVLGWVCDPPEAVYCRVNVPTGACMSTALCGNGLTDPPFEECDDGRGGIAMDSLTCNSDCTAARHGDGKVNPQFEGEQCDREAPQRPGTLGPSCQSPTCNLDCTHSSCGDARTNAMDTRVAPNGEECDLGSRNGDNASCRGNCTNNVCGDGFEDRTNVGGRPAEGCDRGADSARSAEDDRHCSYSPSDPVCWLCRGCEWVEGVRHWCGDGTRDTWDFNLNRALSTPEGCDQGSLNGRGAVDVCVYGQATCSLCTQSCQTQNVTGPVCGDRIVQGGWTDEARTVWYEEECDSDVATACGTCGAIGTSNECRNVPKAAAQGTLAIVANRDLLGVTFAIAWDVSQDPTVFEYVEAGGAVTHAGAVPVVIGADVDATASNTASAVANATTASFGAAFTATANGSVVTITNRTQGIRGNGPIELDPPGTTALQRIDLHGGVGCRQDQPCRNDSDCAEGYYCNNARVCRIRA